MNWPGTTDIIKFHGLSPDFPSDAPATRGRGVHAACHLLAKNDADLEWEARHPECQPYIDAYRQFLREHNFVLLEAEREYRCESLRFISHPDQIGRLDAFGTVDLELKSGGLPRWVQLQTAGQVLAIGAPSMRRFALHLKADGGYTLIPHTDFRDFDRFRSLVDAYWTIQEFRNGEFTSPFPRY